MLENFVLKLLLLNSTYCGSRLFFLCMVSWCNSLFLYTLYCSNFILAVSSSLLLQIRVVVSQKQFAYISAASVSTRLQSIRLLFRQTGKSSSQAIQGACQGNRTLRIPVLSAPIAFTIYNYS